MPYTLDEIFAASVNAVNKMNLRLTAKSKDALSGTIQACDAENESVQFKIRAYADRDTRLIIRVGYLGNKSKSKLILEYVAEDL